MKQLCRTSDQLEAHLLLHRLHDEGISAELRGEHVSTVYGGTFPVSIWIINEADIEAAVTVYQRFLREERGTQLDTSYGQDSLRCAACGYDLRGHHGEGRCPECGRPFRMHGQCGHCGESVPENFDICWKCGAAMGRRETPT